jgi:hypothetical protein
LQQLAILAMPCGLRRYTSICLGMDERLRESHGEHGITASLLVHTSSEEVKYFAPHPRINLKVEKKNIEVYYA